MDDLYSKVAIMSNRIGLCSVLENKIGLFIHTHPLCKM